MFSKVLIGIDGGPGGRDALALARELAAPGAELVLGYVWENGAGVISAITGDPHPATAGHELLQAALRTSDVEASTAVRSASSTAAGLHEMAEEIEADLLVVGSPGRQARGHALIASQVRTALHAAPCAVAVAVRGYAADGRAITKVGVGYEENAIGEGALATARSIASRSQAELDVMLVIAPLPSPWMSEPYAYLAELDDLANDRVKEAQVRLEALEDCTVIVRRGEPAPRLRELSAEVGLLVLGSRGYGPVRRMLLGSTSDAVVEDAGCSVLVLTRPAGQEPDPRRAGTVVEPAAAGGVAP